MSTLGTVLLVFAFVFFCIATFWGFAIPAAQPAPAWGRFNPIAAGLACITGAILFAGVHL
jgi:hypothetical protein